MSTRTEPSAGSVILKAWLLAGSLDIIAACTYYSLRTGNAPIRVLKFVASGVFGADAIQGDSGYAIYGLLFHYLIAFIFTVFFFIVYPYIRLFWENRWLTAFVYGIFVWLVMNRIVLPLSATPRGPLNWQQAAIGALILVCMIGLPLSFIIGRFYSRK